MPLSSNTQAQIAFKNLLGKSQTDPTKAFIINEGYGIFFNVQSSNIWLDTIYNSATSSVLQGTCVNVVAGLTAIPGANNYGHFTIWPNTPPSGVDYKTGLSFSYGVGSLIGLTGGSRITSLISDGYGTDYACHPFDNLGIEIGPTDPRNWVYQYNSGIFYQDNVPGNYPYSIKVYAYIGNTLPLSSSSQNIRVSASGTNSYSSNTSTPIITSYLSNYVYLVDFSSTNNSGTVSLNINSIGTYSVTKYGNSGLTSLLPGDISTGQIYYLLFNNIVNNFVLYNSNPVSTSNSYTNLSPTLNSVGGINNGTVFNNVSTTDILTDILYPEQLGNITSFTIGTSSTFLIGCTSSFTIPFLWTLSNTASFVSNSLKIEDISNYIPTETYWNIGGVIASGISNSSGVYIYSPGIIGSSIQRSRDFKLSIKRSNGTVVSQVASIYWGYNNYYGSSTFSSLTQSQILGLNSVFGTKTYGVYSVTGSGYKYLAVPSVYSSLSNITYKNMPVPMADITDVSGSYTYSVNDIGYEIMTITNSYGIASNYNIYRTVNKISGTISLTIN